MVTEQRHRRDLGSRLVTVVHVDELSEGYQIAEGVVIVHFLTHINDELLVIPAVLGISTVVAEFELGNIKFIFVQRHHYGFDDLDGIFRHRYRSAAEIVHFGAEDTEYLAVDLAVFEVYRVGNFVGIGKFAVCLYLRLRPVVHFLEFFELSIVVDSGGSAYFKRESVVFFPVLLFLAGTADVFDHKVGVLPRYARERQFFYDRGGIGITENTLYGVGGIAVFPVPFAVIVLCKIAVFMLSVSF